MQVAVAGGVVDLQTASERTRLYAIDEPLDPSEPLVCPFRGLAPFDAAHAEYFFGRERLVAELVARLVGSTLLAVFGPSGSGKSSAVRAGLLPALADGVVPGSESWRRAVMRPGARPLAELSRALARAVPEVGREDAAPWIADALERLEPDERLVLLSRSVRGGLRRLSRPRRARGVFRRAGRGYGRPRPAPGLGARDPGRLLRALRRARRALDAGELQPGPGRADAPRRAAPGDRAAGPPGRAADGAAPRLGAGRRRRGRARRPAAAIGRFARALAAPRRSHARPPSPTKTPAASRGRSGAWPRTPTRASATPSGPGRARCCSASPATMRRRRRSSAAAFRSTSSSSTATPTPPGRWPCSPRAGCSQSTRARSRSPTRRCCGSGPACAAGSRPTPRAAVSITT